MRKHLALLFFLTTIAVTAQVVLQNIPNRNKTTLNGRWNYIIDPYETGYYDYHYQPRDLKKNPWKDAMFLDVKQENPSDLIEYSFDDSPVMNIPGDWNSQDERLLYYEGTIWFRRLFDYQKSKDQNRVFVHFGAANYRADVYLNGKKVGVHEGGFTPFAFEVTDVIKEEGNFMIVKVDNQRKRDAVPTVITDWWNYGGITRDVNLIETAETYISDYQLQLQQDDPRTLEGFVSLTGSMAGKQKVQIDIPELKVKKEVVTDVSGKASFTIPVKKVDYWEPNNPKLYHVSITSGAEKLKDQIGFRTIRVEGSNILLNNESIFLRGICMHEENPIKGGRANSIEDARLLLTWAKELGCNFVRLAHYPHNEYMVRLADEIGLLVWEETPVYWNVLFDNPETYQKAEKQLTEVIHRDKNRASVIIWSMANETPQTQDRLNFLRSLADKTREIDGTRLISAALEKRAVPGKQDVLTITDEFADYADLLSFNEYVGWYDGLPEKCDRVTWEITQDKPVFISEFGGGALQGLHGDKNERWTEEFQEDLYIRSLNMLTKIPQLRGMAPWIMADFRSPRRNLPNIQDGWNRKGLLSQTGQKKKSWFVMNKFYKGMKEKWE